MGRAFLKTLRETTLNTFFDWCSRLGITDQYTYNGQDHVINWHNGSQIILKDLRFLPSDDKFDRFGSLEISGAFIDECGQITFLAWQTVMSRIRYKLNEYNIHPKILGTCNPTKNWPYREFYRPKKEGVIKPYRKFVAALPTDNPHLPESYLRSLLQMEKNSRERLYYGNWEYDDDPATLIDQEAISDYFRPDHLKQEGDKYLTIDVARKGKDSTVFRVWHGKVCIYRLSLPKTLIPEIAERGKELQHKYGIPNSRTVVDEDGVGGGVVDIMGCKGFTNNSSPVGEINYKSLKDQCSIRMAKAIQARKYGEISNNGTVKDLVAEEMEQVKVANIDDDGKLSVIKKKKVKENIGRSPDDWDSIMMREYFELGHTTAAWLHSYDRVTHVSPLAVYQQNQIVYVSVNFSGLRPVLLLSHRGEPVNKRYGYIHYFAELVADADWTEQLERICPLQSKHRLFMVTGGSVAGKADLLGGASNEQWQTFMGTMGISWNQVNINRANVNMAGNRSLCNEVFARYDEILINTACTGLISDLAKADADSDSKIVGHDPTDGGVGAYLDCIRYDLAAFNRNFLNM